MENRPGLVSEHMNFIRDLTGAGHEEIQAILSGFARNGRFHDSLAENRSGAGGRRFSSWGITPQQGDVLYSICRQLKPAIVVETGVASGVSSSYILCALEENGEGSLYSIDLPSWGGRNQSGWIIPYYLRHRWHLITGDSKEKLPALLDELGKIDMFMHDSDHSYHNMLGEFRTAWGHLEPGGILIAHNIDWSDAFEDFSESVSGGVAILGDMGGIVKL